MGQGIRLGAVLVLVLAVLAALPAGCAGQGGGGGGGGRRGDDAVLLKDVQALTFHSGRMTKGRRSAPIPQMQCVGEACRRLGQEPRVMQCTNQGFDGVDVQWRCTAELEDLFSLGATTVSCEGYDYPEDPYVLAGSCGVEYELFLTQKGKDYLHGRGGSSQSHYHDLPYQQYGSERSAWGTFIWLLWLTVAGVIAFKVFRSCFGGGSDYSSPPPYPAEPPSYADVPPAYGHSSYPGTYTSQPPRSSGPGFWTGAATGGAMGYLFGRNRGYNQGGYRSSWGAPSGVGWSSPRNESSHYSSSSSSSSSRSAEGYGGTTRR